MVDVKGYGVKHIKPTASNSNKWKGAQRKRWINAEGKINN
jgi:hypothetical protein